VIGFRKGRQSRSKSFLFLSLFPFAIRYCPLIRTAPAIISYRTGKRDSENTDLFIQNLRQRVIGVPEISTDGFHIAAVALWLATTIYAGCMKPSATSVGGRFRPSRA
jgi:hypothetical protein